MYDGICIQIHEPTNGVLYIPLCKHNTHIHVVTILVHLCVNSQQLINALRTE